MKSSDYQRLREVFLSVIEFESEERKVRLLEACGDDENLLAGVRRWLASEEEVSRFLQLGDVEDTHDPVDKLLLGCLAAPESEWNAAVEAACTAHPEHAQTLRFRFAVIADLGLAETRVGVRGLLFQDHATRRTGQEHGSTCHQEDPSSAPQSTENRRSTPSCSISENRRVIPVAGASHPSILVETQVTRSPGYSDVWPRVRPSSVNTSSQIITPARYEAALTMAATPKARAQPTPTRFR